MRAMKSPATEEAKAKRALLILKLVMGVGVILPFVVYFLTRK